MLLSDLLRGQTSQTSYLRPVHKLLSCVIIHSENFQKWVGFTEEILKQINRIKVFFLFSSFFSFPFLSFSSELDVVLSTGRLNYPKLTSDFLWNGAQHTISFESSASASPLLLPCPEAVHITPVCCLLVPLIHSLAWNQLHPNSGVFVKYLLG